MRSNAVNVAVHNALTSAYIPSQVCYSNVCAVRDEEAAGSNPATPTSSQAMTHQPESWPFLIRSTSTQRCESFKVRRDFLVLVSPPARTERHTMMWGRIGVQVNV